MTENKKKRGRPPGRGKRPKIIVAVPDMGVFSDKQGASEEAIAIKEMLEGDPKMSKMVEKSLAMGYVPILKTVDLPSNYAEMGKIQKLEWLTANPRK